MSANRYGETLAIAVQPQLTLLSPERSREKVRTARINLINDRIIPLI